VFRVEGLRQQAVDTTGAGDCFCGALAAGLDRGLALPAAMAFANAAAALSVTRAGAAASIPMSAEVEALLATV
jgi:ribokinase